MENLKRMIKKVMIFLLIFALCVPAMELNNAQAAKLSSRKVDKLYSTELQYVINYAEYLIIGKCISERWFKSIFSQKGKLPDKITDCIWGIFSNSRNQIKETVHFRYLASIDQKLNALMNEHDEIKDELEFVQYLILDRTKQ